MMGGASKKDAGRTIPEVSPGEAKSHVSAALQPGGIGIEDILEPHLEATAKCRRRESGRSGDPRHEDPELQRSRARGGVGLHLPLASAGQVLVGVR